MKRTILIPLLLSTFLLVGYAEKEDIFVLECTDKGDETFSKTWTFNQTKKEANGYPYESPFGDEGTIWFWEDVSKNEYALFYELDDLIITYTDGNKRFLGCLELE